MAAPGERAKAWVAKERELAKLRERLRALETHISDRDSELEEIAAELVEYYTTEKGHPSTDRIVIPPHDDERGILVEVHANCGRNRVESFPIDAIARKHDA